MLPELNVNRSELEALSGIAIPDYLGTHVEDILTVWKRWNSSLGMWAQTDPTNAPNALMARSFSEYKQTDPVNCVVLTGPNGGGKNRFITDGLALYDGALVVRDTTRVPRPNEVDGVDYNF